MDILPSQIELPHVEFGRNHAPKPDPANDYRTFRSCLRWEFGFLCPFCLLHESDLSRQGVEGWGLIQIEHLQSQSAQGAHTYSNCSLICSLCNNTRNNKPRNTFAARLLDPSIDAWAAHFEIQNDTLVPNDGDKDAVYTEKVYALNDRRKIKLRRHRRENIDKWLSQIKIHNNRKDKLLPMLSNIKDTELVKLIKESLNVCSEEIEERKRCLAQYCAIPLDADDPCRCKVTLFLPPELRRQLITL